MKRSMKMALADAHPHGLMRAHNGWIARTARGVPADYATIHSPQTVKALFQRPKIDHWGPERNAFLTEIGEARLADIQQEARK